MREDKKIDTFYLGFGFFVLGMIIGMVAIGLNMPEYYKRGQLDYQAGLIEWQIIDGKLHHITQEAPK